MNLLGLSTFELVITLLSAVAFSGSVLVLSLERLQVNKGKHALHKVATKIREKGPDYFSEAEPQEALLYELYHSFTIAQYASDQALRAEVKELLKRLVPPEEEVKL